MSNNKTNTGVDIDIFMMTAPELIRDVATMAQAILMKEYHQDEKTAKKMGVDVAVAFSKQCGGTQFYIPVGRFLKISKRDMQIYEKFTGDNHNELAKEFGISVQWVYKVIKTVKKQMQDKQQPKLF